MDFLILPRRSYSKEYGKLVSETKIRKLHRTPVVA